MAGHDIIVVGASAGGLEALQALVGGLPADLPAALCVVWHTPPHSRGILADLLDRAGPLPAAYARDGEAIEQGRIYVAPSDRHLLLEMGKLRLTHGPKENLFRPAIDPLFRSAAVVYGPRVIGVVLSGLLNDGTAGLWAITDRGGLAVIQDPDDALFPDMPLSALEHVAMEARLPAAELGPALARLAQRPITHTGATPVEDELEIENRIVMEDNALAAGVTTLGVPSLYTCPECHGVLIQLHGDSLLRFRCHTGHAFTAQALLVHSSEMIEAELWNAVRAMDERLLLLRQVAGQLDAAGKSVVAQQVREQADAVEQQRQTARQLVLQHTTRASRSTD